MRVLADVECRGSCSFGAASGRDVQRAGDVVPWKPGSTAGWDLLMRRLFESLQKSDGDGIQTAPLVIARCVCPTFTLLGTSRRNAKVNGKPLRLDNKTCVFRKDPKTYRHGGI